MTEEPDARTRLATLLQRVVDRERGAKPDLEQWLSDRVGVERRSIAVSLASGGTQQMLNRLGQRAVRNADELTLFLLDDPQDVQPSVEYVREVTAGKREATPPAGPIGFFTPGDGGEYVLKALVEVEETPTSRFVKALYLPEVLVLSGSSEDAPALLPDTNLWLLMSTGQSEYADIDGVRYHFPRSIPNGRQLAEGDVIVCARTKGSQAPDAGLIFGLGRIGRRIDLPDGENAYVYFDRWLEVVPGVDLKRFGDPRVNINSVVKLDQDWVRRLMRRLGVTSIEDLPVPFTALTTRHVQEHLVRQDLFFEDGLVHQIVAALRSGKHVMLTGAPGTGKTSLALALAEAAANVGVAEEPLLTTATADWTSADTVGAYRITKDQSLEFEPGHFTSAVEGRRWLVVDELNRADIDKAIGQLFTVLSGQSVVLPFKEAIGDEDLPIALVPWGAAVPEGTSPREVARNWRLLATLNDRDRDLLFDMSEALMRRFAIVEVAPPTAHQWDRILLAAGTTGVSEWDEALRRLVLSKAFEARPLGAAVILDCAKHLREMHRLEAEVGQVGNRYDIFRGAFMLYVAPQLSTSSLNQRAEVDTLLAAAWTGEDQTTNELHPSSDE